MKLKIFKKIKKLLWGWKVNRIVRNEKCAHPNFTNITKKKV